MEYIPPHIACIINVVRFGMNEIIGPRYVSRVREAAEKIALVKLKTRCVSNG